MNAVKIIGLCIMLACVYGIVHDQITARIYLPYFTEFHPDIGLPNDPTIVGLGWGIIATWWVGAILGVGLAIACTAGRRPKLGVRDLLRPLAILFATMAALATVSGVCGYFFGGDAVTDMFFGKGGLSQSDAARFGADIFAHNASYAVGILGGIVLIVWAVRERKTI